MPTERVPDDVPQALDRMLVAARDGCPVALGHLLEACRVYLHPLAQKQLPDDLRAKVGASDLVQETFLKAQHDFPNFRGQTEGELHAWLRQILQHNLVDLARRFIHAEKRRVEREIALSREAMSEQLPAAGVSPTSQAIVREQVEAMRQALARLPEEAQTIIQWRNDERLSFEEIGQRIGRSAEAARKVWARALTQLQLWMEAPREPE